MRFLDGSRGACPEGGLVRPNGTQRIARLTLCAVVCRSYSARVIDAIQAHESEGLLRQGLQQLFHPLDKRRALIWILLRKSFINLQDLFKCLTRLRWSVLGAIQNTQIVER